MEQNNGNIVDRIIDYLRDKLSNSDRHALEKDFMADPFMQDALDGLSQLSGDQVENDIFELNKRLNEKSNTNKTPKLIPIFKMAASVLLIIGIATSAFFVAQTKLKPKKIAQETHSIEKPIDRLISPEPEASEIYTPKERIKPPIEKDKKRIIKPLKKTPVDIVLSDTEDEIFESESAPIVSYEIMEEKESMEEMQKIELANVSSSSDTFETQKTEVRGIVAMSSSASAPIQSKSRQTHKAFKMVKISGKIVDQSGEPLIGAVVVVKNTEIKTITDKDGNFALNVDASADIQISYIGYLSEEFKSTEIISMEHPIAMHEDLVALNEVVVSGYGKQKRRVTNRERESVAELGYEKAQPKMGIDKFNKYIAKNKRIDNGNSVSITVEFIVSETGDISDIKITNSTDERYNNEAIRLLKEGPRWKPAYQNNIPIESAASVIILF